MQPFRIILALEAKPDKAGEPPAPTRMRSLLKRLLRQHGFVCRGMVDSLQCPVAFTSKPAKRRKKKRENATV